MMISPTFVLWSIYLMYKIVQLVVILIWYLLVALYWLISWPFRAIAEHRRRKAIDDWEARRQAQWTYAPGLDRC